MTKGKNFARFLHAFPLTKLEAWIAYTMFFIPSVTYSAITLSLPMKAITRIHSLYLPVLLSRLVYQSTYSRSIIFAPKHIGGLGITPLNIIITQHKLQFFHRHLRQKTELSKAILINIKWSNL